MHWDLRYHSLSQTCSSKLEHLRLQLCCASLGPPLCEWVLLPKQGNFIVKHCSLAIPAILENLCWKELCQSLVASLSALITKATRSSSLHRE